MKTISDCIHGCSSCGEGCGGHTTPWDFRAPANDLPHIRGIIVVVSGKGDVGKSLVTSSLVMAMRRTGETVGVLDADITGPFIPTTSDVYTKAEGGELDIHPAETKTGIEIANLNLLIENETNSMVWRNPVIAEAVEQFWANVTQGNVGYLLVDMPPGAGDTPPTVFQSPPMDDIVVVTTPQDLVSVIITKVVKMAEMMHILVPGLVENYSYFRCPDCDKEHAIFDEGHVGWVAATLGLRVLIHLPIDPAVAATCDAGRIEELEPNYLTAMAELLVE